MTKTDSPEPKKLLDQELTRLVRLLMEYRGC